MLADLFLLYSLILLPSCAIEPIYDLGGGYYFRIEAQSYNEIFKGTQTGIGVYDIDSAMLS